MHLLKRIDGPAAATFGVVAAFSLMLLVVFGLAPG